MEIWQAKQIKHLGPIQLSTLKTLIYSIHNKIILNKNLGLNGGKRISYCNSISDFSKSYTNPLAFDMW